MAFSNLQHYDKFQEINVEQLNSDLTSSPVSLMGARACSLRDAPTETSPKEVEVTEGIPRGKVKAARPRGGGIEDEDEGRKYRRDYRRFSATTLPPEHQPAYQPQHATDLPTAEDPSGSAVGCGSLPGSCKEFGVARLPDERGNSNPYIFSQATLSETPFKSMLKHQRGWPTKPQQEPTPKEGEPQPSQPHPTQPPTQKEAEQKKQPAQKKKGDQKKAAEKKEVELPTKEVPSGSRVGVGSPPGPNTEAGVATLPEEREGGKPYGSGYTGFEEYSPAEGAKMMHQHMNEHSHKHSGRHNKQKIAQHFEHGDQHVMLKVDLPLEEEPSGSRVGVGSLPGPNTEAGVALLPEERRHHLDDEVVPSLFMPTTEDITISYGGVGSLPGKRSEQGVALSPEERLFPADGILGSHLPPRMDQMPLEEHPSGSVVGVGSLPGTIRESGVAILPDERAEMGLPVDATPRGQATQRGRTLRDAKGETWQPKDKAMGETREERMAREIRCMPCFTQPSVQPKGMQGVKAVDKKGERLKSWGMERKSGAKGEGREEEEGVRYSNHEKVVRYFQKIDHHVMPKVDLPLEEEASGSYVGVGSLPGPRTESGVAVLPEERKHHMDNELDPALYMPSTEDQMLSVGGVGSLPGKRSEQGVAMLPEERLFPADEIMNSHLPPRADQLPSTELISGSPIGVGSLPGKRSEQRVALTPEERLHPADQILMSHLPPRMDQLPSREHVSGSTIGVGSLPGQRTEKGVALTPEERQHPADQILMRKTKTRPPFGKGGHGHSRRKSEGLYSSLSLFEGASIDMVNIYVGGNAAHAHTSGFQTRTPEGQAQRRRGEKAEGAEKEEEHGAEGGGTGLPRKPSVHGKASSGQPQKSQASQGQGQGQAQPEQHRPTGQRTYSEEMIEEERKRVEHHFEMARKAAEMVGTGLTTAVEGVGSVVTGITAPHYQPPQTHESIEADRLRAEQRGEMMRNTMERFESSIEGVGNRVRHAFGWDHPAGAPASGGSAPGPATQGAPSSQPAMPTLGTTTSGGALGDEERQQKQRDQAERKRTQEQQALLDRAMEADRERARRGSGSRVEQGLTHSTMEQVQGGVNAAVEGVGKGVGDVSHALEDMGHRVGDMGYRWWESMGKHPGGGPQPRSGVTQQPAKKAPSGISNITVPSGGHGSTGGTHAVHSNLSPTAPEFVPSQARGAGQEHTGHAGNESSWWPHVGAAPPLSGVMRDMREKVEGYLHLGHGEEGQPQQDKGGETHRAPPLKTATPTMDKLAGHATRASDKGGKVSDRASDNFENVDRGTTDDAGARESDEAMLRSVHAAEDLLRHAAREELKAGIALGTPASASQKGKTAPPLPQRHVSESTLQKQAGAEGEVTTLESSGHIGSVKAPLGMPTCQRQRQTSIPSTLHEQYFMTAGREGEVTTLGGTGDLGTLNSAQSKDTLRGVGGVGFSMEPGEGGVLPGYPTAQGMSQMMQQRMADDQARQARVGTGSQGVETTTNSLKGAPHLESGLAVSRGRVSRAESDISVQAVHGSTTDLGTDNFTGNKTPRSGSKGSPMDILGAPVSKHDQPPQGYEHHQPVQRN
ncbi:hypothetical protein FA13DRAFT_1779831 [Coprinellus micaceus]|uniref:Uncharacterized protein n=1 Tax=Coprinellus micaceus TaxID=71717 RepID=A0A4Y7SF50_COPMI|nr:hypothetical protein FA13DRAFT_1779831 [Coprinellus micaceus]